ncbi:MAG: alpha/beta fold hydrolase, partial [Bacteroidota bacterium]
KSREVSTDNSHYAPGWWRISSPTNEIRMKPLFFYLLGCSVFLCTCGRAQTPPTLAIEPYTFQASDGRSTEAELGSFTVPQNRAKPNGKQLTLRFVRFKSTNPTPGHPIVYLAGGPGGSGINAAKYARYDLFQALRSVADVIAYDQRGTGKSDGPPAYPGVWAFDPGTPMTEAAVRPIIQQATQEAAAFFREQGSDLSAYNSNASADDLNDLRQALGAEKLNLWSISYGSHLALTTLKRHEQHLDRIILAGVEGYDHTVKLPADQQALLETIDAQLKANPTTASIYPDFLGDMKRLLDKVSTSPAIIKGKHPMTGDEVPVAIGRLEMQLLISWSLGGPESFRELPLMVQQMLNGNYSGVSNYAFYTKAGRFQGMSLGMDLASGISKERRARLKAQKTTTLLGDAINFPYLHQYDALPELDAGADFRAPYPSKIPVLCISGTLDGRTPPGNAKETLKHLPNGRHLIVEGAGHSDPLFLSSPRILEIMEAFLKGKKIDNEKITLPPVEWVLPKEAGKR